MLGFVDNLKDGILVGWHLSDSHENQVDVYVNDQWQQTLQCEVYRQDLIEQGIKEDGRAGFEIQLDVKPYDLITVCCHQSGHLLNNGSLYANSGRFLSVEAFSDTYLAHQIDSEALLDSIIKTFPKVKIRPLLNSFNHWVGFVVQQQVQENYERSVLLKKTRQQAAVIQQVTQHVLEKTNITYPKVQKTLVINDESYLLYEYIEGQSLSYDVLSRFYDSTTEEVLFELIDQVSELNSYKPKTSLDRKCQAKTQLCFSRLQIMLWTICKKLALNVNKLGVKELLFISRLMFKLTHVERVFSHGDLHPGNVMLSEHGLTIIDWDKLGLLPIGFDLAEFYRSHAMFKSEDKVRQILTRYSHNMQFNAKQMKQLEFSFWALVYIRFALNTKGFCQSQEAQKVRLILKSYLKSN